MTDKMAGGTRIPGAELTGPYGWLVKRMPRKLLGDLAELLALTTGDPQGPARPPALSH